MVRIKPPATMAITAAIAVILAAPAHAEPVGLRRGHTRRRHPTAGD